LSKSSNFVEINEISTDGNFLYLAWKHEGSVRARMLSASIANGVPGPPAKEDDGRVGHEKHLFTQTSFRHIITASCVRLVLPHTSAF
jgi:hypothetical protein